MTYNIKFNAKRRNVSGMGAVFVIIALNIFCGANDALSSLRIVK